MFYQITSDRKTGNILGTEILYPMPERVWDFLASQIRKGKDRTLIARHLPAYQTGTTRTQTKIAKVKGEKESYMWTLPKGKAWVKVNGKKVEGPKVELFQGDVITYPRDKQPETIKRQKFINEWIKGFFNVMGWSIQDYKNFRKEQNTPEQKFASKSVLNMPKAEFMKMLDRLTSGQRFRVAKTVAYKEGDKLVAKEKWGKLGEYYIEWETAQEQVAQKLRDAAASGDKEATEKLKKEYKVKGTGKNTIDLLKDMFSGNLNSTQIDNTYQAMVENMDLIANIFPVVDGSGSMDSAVNGGGYYSARNGQLS